MSENTKIEWCDHTFNPWEGCQKVGPGCDHCYAETRNARFAGGAAINWGPGAPRRRTSVSNWNKPRAWNAKADAFMAQHGRRQRVFCASLADVFDNAVNTNWRYDLFELISETPHLDWLLLTKRIGNVESMLADVLEKNARYSAKGQEPRFHEWGVFPWKNIWIGATITSQEEADRDIPKLLAVPARVRFLSMEPLLGPVDLTSIDVMGGHGVIFPLKGTTDCVDDEGTPADDVPALDWVIVGGESGPGARPMHPDWARSLRDQCQAAGTPFLFKQWGEWSPGDVPAAVKAAESVRVERSGAVNPWPPAFDPGNGDWCMHKVGKKAAGRLLDGRTWDGFPP